LFFLNYNRCVNIDVAPAVSLLSFLQSVGLDVLGLAHSGGCIETLSIGFLGSILDLVLAYAQKVPFRKHLLAHVADPCLRNRNVDVYGVPNNKSIIDSENFGIFNHKVKDFTLTSIFY